MALYRPYGHDSGDFIYNGLFCDEADIFRDAANAEPMLRPLFDYGATTSQLRDLAENDRLSTRYRLLAYKRLRGMSAGGAQARLMGVIVEMPFEEGLDVLAAYADGSVRYINRAGRMTFVEPGLDDALGKVRRLLEISVPIAAQIPVWTEERLPPPRQGATRFTFLVTNGMHVGERPSQAMPADPVFQAATDLLELVLKLDVAAQKQQQQ